METNKLREIAEWFANWNITLYYVGGCVRDSIVELPVEDYDICIVGGKTAGNIHEKLEILHQFGQIRGFTSVFNDFPIWIVDIDGDKYEFAMARTERKIGQSHQDFLTEVRDVIIEQDLYRRDLTINAIAKNILTGEIIDPYDGQFDIKHGIIRPVSAAFKEDALRVIRAARFMARFEFIPSPNLVAMCKEITGKEDISTERVGMELMKMMKTAKKPSYFFKFLAGIDWLNPWFKELHDCIGVPQSPKHHPEGCVYNHLMHCIDNVPIGDWFLRAVMLCHDLGKVSTTIVDGVEWSVAKKNMLTFTLAPSLIESKGLKVSSVGHEEASVPLTYSMLKRIHFTDHKTIRKIGCLVRLHMIRGMIENGNYDKIIRRTLRELMRYDDLFYFSLVKVTMYDLNGRPPKPPYTLEGLSKDLYVDHAMKLIRDGEMTAIVGGEQLLPLGFVEGKEMGEVINKALELQDRGTLKKDNWYNVLKGTFPKIFKRLENEKISDSSTSESGQTEEGSEGDDTRGI